jgi:hypothetical protein
VIVYQASKQQFLRQVLRDDIEEVMSRQFRAATGHGVGPSELNAWKHSLFEMSKVLQDEEIPDDAGIAIEFQLPQSSRRIDFIIAGEDQDAVLLQDAVKNRVELVSRRTDITYDPAVSRATVEMVWAICRERPGCLLIPGHDLPMVIENGVPRQIGHHGAGVKAWFGEELDDMTRIDLVPQAKA